MDLGVLKQYGLKWSAINWENNFLTIKHTVTKVKGRGENQEIHSKEFTKNTDIRTLPLLPKVKEILIEHKRKIEENKKFYGNAYFTHAEDYICVDEQGALLRLDYVTSVFGKKLKEFGLRHLKFHGLRHSCASILAQNNCSISLIQSYLGHKSIKSSAIYQHLDYNAQKYSGQVISEQLQKAACQ